jgi:hypothetical protein
MLMVGAKGREGKVRGRGFKILAHKHPFSIITNSQVLRRIFILQGKISARETERVKGVGAREAREVRGNPPWAV